MRTIRTTVLLFMTALSGCLFYYGDAGDDCYPNHTCNGDLVCVEAPNTSYPWGICARPERVKVGGKNYIFIHDGGLP